MVVSGGDKIVVRERVVMKAAQKIGCGIVTYNRPAGLSRLLKSISNSHLDEVVVVNDGDKLKGGLDVGVLLENDLNVGVGASKNRAASYLLEKGCEHIFLVEDDVYVKDASVFERYIQASKISGLQHLNFSQHGLLNKDGEGKAKPVMRVDYCEVRLALYRHCVGAFSYYSRDCLRKVGLMDLDYFNALEHVDHSLRIIKEGMHPAFWFFADIENSESFIGDEPWAIAQSKISSNPAHAKNVAAAIEVFEKKYGVKPGDYPVQSREKVAIELVRISEKYAERRAGSRASVTVDFQ